MWHCKALLVNSGIYQGFISLNVFINGLDDVTVDSLSVFVGGQDRGGQVCGKVAQRYLDKWGKEEKKKKEKSETKIIKESVPEVECLYTLGAVCLSSSIAAGP